MPTTYKFPPPPLEFLTESEEGSIPLEETVAFEARLSWLEEQNPQLLKVLLKTPEKLLYHLREVAAVAGLKELNMEIRGKHPRDARDLVMETYVAPAEPAPPEEKVLTPEDERALERFRESVENGPKTYPPEIIE